MFLWVNFLPVSKRWSRELERDPQILFPSDSYPLSLLFRSLQRFLLEHLERRAPRRNAELDIGGVLYSHFLQTFPALPPNLWSGPARYQKNNIPVDLREHRTYSLQFPAHIPSVPKIWVIIITTLCSLGGVLKNEKDPTAFVMILLDVWAAHD